MHTHRPPAPFSPIFSIGNIHLFHCQSYYRWKHIDHIPQSYGSNLTSCFSSQGVLPESGAPSSLGSDGDEEAPVFKKIAEDGAKVAFSTTTTTTWYNCHSHRKRWRRTGRRVHLQKTSSQKSTLANLKRSDFIHSFKRLNFVYGLKRLDFAFSFKRSDLIKYSKRSDSCLMYIETC